MTEDTKFTESVRKSLASEPRLRLHDYPIAVSAEGGAVVLEGEVQSVAAKKLALERVASLAGVTGVVDRLRVGVRGRSVTLGGSLPSEAQRDMAENDAWYEFGVDRVVNDIEVRP